MSIASAINDLKGRISAAYDALELKGATIPESKTTANLPDTIATVSTGKNATEVIELTKEEIISGRKTIECGKWIRSRSKPPWNTSSIEYAFGMYFCGTLSTQSSEPSIYYSFDCDYWYPTNFPSGLYVVNLFHANGILIASVSGGGMYYTLDGKTWSQTNVTNSTQYKIIYERNNNIFVCTSYQVANAGLFYSTDGITWTKATDAAQFRNGLTYNNNKFIAASYNGPVKFYTSTDGQNWTKTSEYDFGSVCCDLLYRNNILIITIYYRGLYYSTDEGVTWTRCLNDPNNTIENYVVPNGTTVGAGWTFYGLKYLDNTFYLYSGGIVNSKIAKSKDGITWTQISEEFGAFNYGKICLIYVNNRFICSVASMCGILYKYNCTGLNPIEIKLDDSISAVNNTTKTITLTSSDVNGKTVSVNDEWKIISDVTPVGTSNNRIYDFCYNGKILLCGFMSTGIWYSEDGVHWSQSNLNNGNVTRCAYLNGLYLASYNCIDSSNTGVYYSKDGKEWTKSDYTSTCNYFNYMNGAWYFSTTSNGTYKSTNGSNWTRIDDSSFPGRTLKFLQRNGITVIAGNGGIYYTTDFENINKTNITTSISDIIWCDDKFLARGGWGIYYSYDGINWIGALPSTNLVSGTNIFYANRKYLFCKTNNGIWASNDGINWHQTNVTTDSIYQFSYGNEKFLAIGPNGTKIYYSNDGETWTKYDSLSDLKYYRIIYAFNKFIVGLFDAPTLYYLENYTGFDSVTINPITSAIDSNIQSQNIKSGVSILGINGSLTPGMTPTGNINITNTNQTDVTNYATAQVVDSNLTAGNIKKDVSILGVTGTYEGSGSGLQGYTLRLRGEAGSGSLTIYHPDGTSETAPFYSGSAWTTYTDVAYLVAPFASGADGGVVEAGGNYTIMLTSDKDITITWGCMLKGTKVNLWNGNTKLIEDITYNDEILCWNFDECKYTSAKPFWIKKAQKNTFYWVNKFESGLEIKTTGTVAGHRFFNMDKNRFLYNTECIGDYCYTINGKDRLLEAKYVEDDCIFYNVYTHYHMNLFANNILTGFRYNNLYPIKDMKFIKDNRKLRDRMEFQNIPDSWYYGMRCSEQTDSVQNIEDYVIQREIIKKEF